MPKYTLDVSLADGLSFPLCRILTRLRVLMIGIALLMLNYEVVYALRHRQLPRAG